MLQTVTGHTFHKRIGGPDNAFRYGVDYVLIEPERLGHLPAFMSFNSRNIVAVHEKDHGGAPKRGRGTAWVREVLDQHGLEHLSDARILLLTQPRMFGYLFNPVSFWLIVDPEDQILAVISEVSNTFGDRHSYLCHHDDLRPIGPNDVLTAQKVFHVSPFQPVSGEYKFRFDLSSAHISIRIDYINGNAGLVATLMGKRAPLTGRSLLRAMVRRPLGSLRVMALIHWQAVKLKLKGAKYRRRPEPPKAEVS